jgi:hypothetical protein
LRLHPPRSSGLAAATTILVAIALVLALVAVIGARSDDGPGQVWRRGWLGGEQIRLLEEGRYHRQTWSVVAGDETFESGAWSPLAEVVSLVPGAPGQTPRLMRKTRIDGDWYLFEPTPSGDRPEPEAFYELID